MLNRVVYVLFFVLVSGQAVFAQEKLGITNSNYSSTNSIFLNPSSSVDSRTYKQFNLVGANVYAMNNIGYIPEFSVWSVIKNGGVKDYEIGNLKLKKFLMVVASLEAPAFVMSKGEYGGGIFFRARSVGEVKRVPFELVNLWVNPDTSKAIDYLSDLNLRNLRFSNMTWAEYGLNFGKMVRKNKTNLWTLGGSLRYLTGISISYGLLQQLKVRIDTLSLEVEKLKGKLRYNEFGWNTGRGAGMDIGFTYKRMLDVVERYYANSEKSNCKYIDYKYKIGVSLRDLGFIRFKKNTSTSDIDDSGSFQMDTATRRVNIRQNLETNFDTDLKHGPILATLPTALSVQLDWNFGNHFYLNGTVVKNLVPNSFTGAQGSNLVSVCPRYEFKQFEIAMPFTLQKFIYPQLGFAFRVKTFVLGFDNVFPLIFKKKTYGLNIYFNIGFSRFTNPACNKRNRRLDDCGPNASYKKKKREKRKLAPVRKKDFSKPRKIRR